MGGLGIGTKSVIRNLAKNIIWSNWYVYISPSTVTHLYQFQIKTVSWSGQSFMGFTETDQLVTYNKHESKDFKLNVADMEILKNNK